MMLELMDEPTPIYNRMMVTRKWTPADLHDHSQCVQRIMLAYASKLELEPKRVDI